MMTSFKELRERRHAQWLLKLKQELRDVVADRNRKMGTNLHCRFTSLAPAHGEIGTACRIPA